MSEFTITEKPLLHGKTKNNDPANQLEKIIN